MHLAPAPPALLLQGLHLEGNPWRVQLPPAPCFGRLLELLLDWKDALRSPGVLRCATALTRLVLTDHSAVVLSPPAGRLVLGAETADALLDALASLPRLQRLEDVVNPRATISHRPDVLTPAPARVMWEAGRRCPALHLDVIPYTYIGERRRQVGGLGRCPKMCRVRPYNCVRSHNCACTFCRVVPGDAAGGGGRRGRGGGGGGGGRGGGGGVELRA